MSLLLLFRQAAEAGVTGSLAATETGSDTAALSGVVLVSGQVSAAESGSDTAALTGTVLVQGALGATESGADIANIGGENRVSGYLGATESDADTAAFTGAVLVSGSITVTESGADVSALSGAVAVSGALAATESAADVAAITGTLPGAVTEPQPAAGSGRYRGNRPANEVDAWQQWPFREPAKPAPPPVRRGALRAVETGEDGCSVVVAVRVAGRLRVSEAGEDRAYVDGFVLDWDEASRAAADLFFDMAA